MKNFWRYLVIAILFFVFGLSVYHNCFIEDVKLKADTPDTLLIRKIKNYETELDSMRGILVIGFKRIDTVLVAGDSAGVIAYEIPIIPYVFLDSVAIDINKKREYVVFKLMVDGYVTEYNIWQEKRSYTIPVEQRKNIFGKWYVKTGLVALGVAVFYVLVLK